MSSSSLTDIPQARLSAHELQLICGETAGESFSSNLGLSLIDGVAARQARAQAEAEATRRAGDALPTARRVLARRCHLAVPPPHEVGADADDDDRERSVHPRVPRHLLDTLGACRKDVARGPC